MWGYAPRLEENHRHSTAGVRARCIIGEIEVTRLGGQKAAVRGCLRAEGGDGYDRGCPGLVGTDGEVG